MTDDTIKYAETGCPGTKDGIHVWEPLEDRPDITACIRCGAQR